MIYYVLKILCSEHSKSERAESAPPALDRVKNILTTHRQHDTGFDFKFKIALKI